MKNLSEQRAKNLKVIQEKMKLNQKEVKRFNPVGPYVLFLSYVSLICLSTILSICSIVINFAFRLMHFLVILLYSHGSLIF